MDDIQAPRVYVDDMFADPSWGKWAGGGHLTGDSDEALHAMAAKLGLRRSWFQTKPGRPWLNHYDLTKGKRFQAIRLGAVPINWREAGLQAHAARDRALQEAEIVLPVSAPATS
jgi:hypothetical protein